MTITGITEDEYARLVAHPFCDEKNGWYICFVHGSDAGEVARVIQHFLELDYEFLGQPFVFNGEVYQAMFNPLSMAFNRTDRMNAERQEAPRQHETESVARRILDWLRIP